MAWCGEYDIQPHENIEDGTMELKSVWRDFLYSAEKISDIQQFFAEIHLNYYAEMNSMLKEINVDVLSTCNSNAIGSINVADSYTNSQTDFVSRKAIWPEPSIKSSRKLTDSMVIPHYKSAISDEYGGIIGEFGKNRISGSPYVISAWSVLETNPFMSEMPLLMAVMSARQGWNALQYSFVVDNFKFDEVNKIEDFYSSYKHPIRMAMMPVSATLFYTTAEEEKTDGIDYTNKEIFSFDSLDEYEEKELIAKVYDAKWYDNKVMYFYNPFARISNYELFTNKFGINITDKSFKSSRFGTNNHEIIKNNGMEWDMSEGTFEIETDVVQAATGVLDKPIDLTNLYFENSMYTDVKGWGTTVSLMAADGVEIEKSEKMLLTTVARAVNTKFQSSQVRYDRILKSPKTTGMIYNAGEGPIMVESVTGKFVLKVKDDFDVFALSSSGERLHEITTTRSSEGDLVFNISKSNASQHYEIVKCK